MQYLNYIFDQVVSEARRNLEKNPFIDPYEQIEKYKGRTDIFLSYVRGTKEVQDFLYSKKGDMAPDYIRLSRKNEPKIGINTTSHYNTPLGIYTYPLTDGIFDKVSQNLRDVPFAGDKPYIAILKVKPGSKVINDMYTEYDSSNYDSDSDKLHKFFVKEKSLLTDNEFNRFKRYAEENSSEKNAITSMWNLTRILGKFLYYIKTEGKKENLDPAEFIYLHEKVPGELNIPALKWSRILNGVLGYDLICDRSGHGYIHSAERTQAVFLNPRAYEIVDVIRNNVSNKKDLEFRLLKKNRAGKITEGDIIKFFSNGTIGMEEVLSYFTQIKKPIPDSITEEIVKRGFYVSPRVAYDISILYLNSGELPKEIYLKSLMDSMHWSLSFLTSFLNLKKDEFLNTDSEGLNKQYQYLLDTIFHDTTEKFRYIYHLNETPELKNLLKTLNLDYPKINDANLQKFLNFTNEPSLISGFILTDIEDSFDLKKRVVDNLLKLKRFDIVFTILSDSEYQLKEINEVLLTPILKSLSDMDSDGWRRVVDGGNFHSSLLKYFPNFFKDIVPILLNESIVVDSDYFRSSFDHYFYRNEVPQIDYGKIKDKWKRTDCIITLMRRFYTTGTERLFIDNIDYFLEVIEKNFDLDDRKRIFSNVKYFFENSLMKIVEKRPEILFYLLYADNNVGEKFMVDYLLQNIINELYERGKIEILKNTYNRFKEIGIEVDYIKNILEKDNEIHRVHDIKNDEDLNKDIKENSQVKNTITNLYNEVINESSFSVNDLNLETIYQTFKNEYDQSTGNSWDIEKFRNRVQNWDFYGNESGFVAVRRQKSGYVKLVGMAGSNMGKMRGIKEILSQNLPVWGFVTPNIANMAKKLGFIIPHPLVVKYMIKFIPKEVFGGVDFTVNNDGTITLHYNDVGDSTKTLICTKEYIKKSLGNMTNKIPFAIRKLIGF